MEAMHLLDNWRKVIIACRDNKGQADTRNLLEISHDRHCMKPEGGKQCVAG